jgi:uncharacterized protein (DUF1697 family)
MDDLKSVAEKCGLDAVATVGSTGNLLLRAPERPVAELEQALETGLEQRFAKRIPVIVRSAEDFCRLPDRNPFGADRDAKMISVRIMRDRYEEGFLDDIGRFVDDEEFAVVDGDLWIAFNRDPALSRLAGAVARRKPERVGTFRTLAMIDRIVAALERLPPEGSA